MSSGRGRQLMEQMLLDQGPQKVSVHGELEDFVPESPHLPGLAALVSRNADHQRSAMDDPPKLSQQLEPRHLGQPLIQDGEVDTTLSLPSELERFTPRHRGQDLERGQRIVDEIRDKEINDTPQVDDQDTTHRHPRVRSS